MTQLVRPHLVDRESGRTVNISSIGGQWGGVNQARNATAKAGIIRLDRSIAKTYGRHGITANAVTRGLVKTEMSAGGLRRPDGEEKLRSISLRMRRGGGSAPQVSQLASSFAIGRGTIVRDGTDVIVVACGVEVERTLDAATMLKSEGIDARVLAMSTVEPVNRGLLEHRVREKGVHRHCRRPKHL